MGVSIREILQAKFFKDYELLAGRNGIDTEIQGITLFDAPDGYKWTKGKELLLTTGYFFKDDIELFKDIIRFIGKNGNSAMGIKKDRFIKNIPKEILDLCDELAIPLISIPFNVAWIDIINEVNSIVMNRFISRIIDIYRNKQSSTSNDTQTIIESIVRSLSIEMRCPTSIKNILDKNIVIYPLNYKSKQEILNLSETELSNYQKVLLCNKLDIYRITDINSNKSWVDMTIKINNVPLATVTVWEENRIIDYYDLFALRLAYTLLTEIYQQIYIMNSFERMFYDDFIKSLLNDKLDNKEKLTKAIKGINDFRLNINSKFICIAFVQEKKGPSLYAIKEKLYNTLLLGISKDEAIFGIIDDNTLVIIKDVVSYKNDVVYNVRKEINELLEKIRNALNDVLFKVGIGDVVDDICFIKRSYYEALKAIEIGKYIYSKKNVVSFEELGPFGLFRLEDLQRKSFGGTFKSIAPIFEESNSEELLSTLKVYLESESNCNIAAQKLFIHSNTVRYRIAKIQELCNIDLEDPIERLKMEIALSFIDGLNKEIQ